MGSWYWIGSAQGSAPVGVLLAGVPDRTRTPLTPRCTRGRRRCRRRVRLVSGRAIGGGVGGAPAPSRRATGLGDASPWWSRFGTAIFITLLPFDRGRRLDPVRGIWRRRSFPRGRAARGPPASVMRIAFACQRLRRHPHRHRRADAVGVRVGGVTAVHGPFVLAEQVLLSCDLSTFPSLRPCVSRRSRRRAPDVTTTAPGSGTPRRARLVEYVLVRGGACAGVTRSLIDTSST